MGIKLFEEQQLAKRLTAELRYYLVIGEVAPELAPEFNENNLPLAYIQSEFRRVRKLAALLTGLIISGSNRPSSFYVERYPEDLKLFQGCYVVLSNYSNFNRLPENQ